jgi:hypothetical protein
MGGHRFLLFIACLISWLNFSTRISANFIDVHQFNLQLPVQSVPITTNVVSLNLAQARCTQYNIMWFYTIFLFVVSIRRVVPWPCNTKMSVAQYHRGQQDKDSRVQTYDKNEGEYEVSSFLRFFPSIKLTTTI